MEKGRTAYKLICYLLGLPVDPTIDMDIEDIIEQEPYNGGYISMPVEHIDEGRNDG